eukprot:331937_1
MLSLKAENKAPTYTFPLPVTGTKPTLTKIPKRKVIRTPTLSKVKYMSHDRIFNPTISGVKVGKPPNLKANPMKSNINQFTRQTKSMYKIDNDYFYQLLYEDIIHESLGFNQISNEKELTDWFVRYELTKIHERIIFYKITPNVFNEQITPNDHYFSFLPKNRRSNLWKCVQNVIGDDTSSDYTNNHNILNNHDTFTITNAVPADHDTFRTAFSSGVFIDSILDDDDAFDDDTSDNMFQHVLNEIYNYEHAPI